jgi:hypothetical protein
MGYYGQTMAPQFVNPEYVAQLQSQLGQYQQQLQQMQQRNQGLIVEYVQGEASADVFPVNNGQKVILFDIDNPFVYHKERDINGSLTKKKFRLVEEKEETPAKVEPIDMSQYIKADDIALIVAEAVDKKMSEYTLKPTKKKVVVEEE